MTNRALIAIGCNTYLKPLALLKGAENDATQIFNCLTDPDRGNYNISISKLLLSPNLETFRAAINDVLFVEGGLEVLTIFFAGHGGPKNGSYYFCLADTDLSRMSTTAYPLNSLFTALNECQPSEINIIIDSCQAGGLVGDLSILLKPENSGSNKSSCISLLAAASSNEYASEVNGNGVVTKLILEYLNGDKKLNSSHAYLDLTEIGREITTKIEQEYNQTPTTYGLSLHGQPRFSKNPHFNPDKLSEMSDKLFEIAPDSELAKKIDKYTEALWDEYRAIEVEPDAERLATLLRKVLDEIANDQDAIAIFINGVSNNLYLQALKSPDVCGAITIISTLLVLLQKYLDNSNVRITMLSLLEQRRLLLVTLAETLEKELKRDNFYLVNKSSCLADFFYLPIRISKVLGSLWSQVLVDLSSPDESFNQSVVAITAFILENYKASIVSISDEQAPYIYIIAKASKATPYKSITGALIHLYIQDLITRKGHLADISIKGDEVLTFLLNRNSATEKFSPELLANPSQLITVCMSVAKDFVNVESLNKNLISLDHQNLFVFIPDSYTSFSDHIIYDGVNNTFQIGHGIWTLQDFESEFNNECLPYLTKNLPSDRLLQLSSIISSLIFPNRIPWFLEAI